MALKDWKQIRNIKRAITWVNSNKEYLLEIYKQDNGTWTFKKINNRTGNVTVSKSFKTKTQALKYVKSYMKTH